jgi:hypothetical protein
MRIRLQGMGFLVCLLGTESAYAMDSSLSMEKVAQLWVAKAAKSRAIQERQVAEHTSSLQLINKKDCNGRTRMHHCIIRSGTTVEEITFLIEHGGRLDIKAHNGEDPYNYGVLYKSLSPHGNLKELCFYNRRIVNFVHSEMLLTKLLMLANNEYRQEGTAKKSSFYKIT